MHRIDNATKLTDANGAGKDGYTEGKATARPPVPRTIVTADALNAIQEELANAIEAGGVTLNKANNGQLASLMTARAGAEPTLRPAQTSAPASNTRSTTFRLGPLGVCVLESDHHVSGAMAAVGVIFTPPWPIAAGSAPIGVATARRAADLSAPAAADTSAPVTVSVSAKSPGDIAVIARGGGAAPNNYRIHAVVIWPIV